MDKYIIERRARVRIAWFKRYEEIGNISQICREFGTCPQNLLLASGLAMLKKDFQGLRIAQELIAKLRHKSHYGPRRLAYYLERGYGIKIIRIAP